MISMSRLTAFALALLAFAVLTAPPAAAQGCSAQVFEHIDFGGESFRTDQDIAWVGDRWNDRISSIVVEAGVWEFYEHINYGGRSFRMGPGERAYVGDAWNDRISSMRCIGPDRRSGGPEPGAPRGDACAVTMYEHVDFAGAAFEARRDVPWVGDRWNDRISSIVVESGIWEFFEDINFGGRSFQLGPGQHRALGQFWNDRISSFRCLD